MYKCFMIYEHDTYKEILQSELERRIEVNPLFSANAFAKKLGISQSYLSLILNGKRSLNERVATGIADNLNFSKLEKEYFLLLTKRGSSLTDELYDFYQGKIEDLRKKNNVDFLDIEKFHVISDWHYSALLECLNLTNIDHNNISYAEKLGLDVGVVDDALVRLEKLDIISQKGERYIRHDNGFLTTPHEIKSLGLRKFHNQILEMAQEAIESQSIEERNISGITVSIDQNKLPEAKRRVQKFMEELMEFLEDGDRTEVYQLSVQLFKLIGKQEKQQ